MGLNIYEKHLYVILICISSDFEICTGNYGESNPNRAISINQHFFQLSTFTWARAHQRTPPPSSDIFPYEIESSSTVYEINSKDATCLAQFKFHLLTGTSSHEMCWATQLLTYVFHKRYRGLKHLVFTWEIWL